MQPSQTETTAVASQLLSAMANTNSNPQLHIAIVPWLAFGHINPYLELAKLLAQKAVLVAGLGGVKKNSVEPKGISCYKKRPSNYGDLHEQFKGGFMVDYGIGLGGAGSVLVQGGAVVDLFDLR
ncbi:hypothetical protein LguiB_032709 [Lonicera macranthoides]